MKYLCLFLSLFLSIACSQKEIHCVVEDSSNELCSFLSKEDFKLIYHQSIDELLAAAPDGSAAMLLCDHYPQQGVKISAEARAQIKAKKIRLFVEYLQPNDSVKPVEMHLERGVVMQELGKDLPFMSILSFNQCFVMPLQADTAWVVTAKVAGFDQAVYGLENTPYHNLIFVDNDSILVSATRLSHFVTARYMPEHRVKSLFEKIVSWMFGGEEITFKSWPMAVTASYGEKDILPKDARKESIRRGVEWFTKARLLVHPTWKESWADKYMGDGTMPVGPEVPANFQIGDGSCGVLEGHMSGIYSDGKQSYRYWMRDDVQGESAYAFSIAGVLLDSAKYAKVATNLLDYSFREYRDGVRNDKNATTFGLLGWAYTHKDTYYGDDNARSILGSLGAASLLNNSKWNQYIIECIVGNFRTTGKNGYRGGVLYGADMLKRDWKSYYNGDIINTQPHFESWNWACFLWLYSKTNYAPLLDRVKQGIQIMMERYPNEWGWTNGIQQERARMILPLAWLVRVEPSEQHIKWLDFMVDELLKNQVACGGIREELGDPSRGMFGQTKSNDDYGKHEAPLIYQNGDPICDMLYTTNFAFAGLNEAAAVMKQPKYEKALADMSDFLTRIQVKSDIAHTVDGAWFRAFNYEDWNFWASNADAGWGAWSTLTGWIQSWIVGTQGLIEMETSLWDLSQKIEIGEQGNETIKSMMK